jgi:hypothetical protein
MSTQRRDDLPVAVALARFAYDFDEVDPTLADDAWQLAADRFVAWDVDPATATEELWTQKIGTQLVEILNTTHTISYVWNQSWNRNSAIFKR